MINYNKLKLKFKICRRISKVLPHSIENDFYGHQEKFVDYIWRMERFRLDKKIDWLISQHNYEMRTKVKPIDYYCLISKSQELKVSQIR